jgi:hypothetical protein
VNRRVLQGGGEQGNVAEGVSDEDEQDEGLEKTLGHGFSCSGMAGTAACPAILTDSHYCRCTKKRK